MPESKFKGVIRKAEVTPKGTVKVDYVDNEMEYGTPSNKVHKFSNNRLAHKDLKHALSLLLSHAMYLGEFIPKGKKIDAGYIKRRDVVNDPDYKDFEVTGIKYKGDDDETEVIIMVQKNVNQGGVIRFEIPAVKILAGSGYDFSGNLAEDLEEVEEEFRAYMDGKYADSNQQTINFDGETPEESPFG